MSRNNNHFEINGLVLSQENCGMRISADTVSFADWLNVTEGSRILDVGTGCGILALLCAQKGAAEVTGIEIESGAADTARQNFRSSAVQNKMTLIHADVRNFSLASAERYDHIISNPPWYRDSPSAANQARQQARIQDSLKIEDLLNISELLLKEGGKLSLLLPVATHESFRTKAELKGWWPQRIGRLFSKKDSSPLRFFSEWKKGYCHTERQDIFRQDSGLADKF